MPAVFGDRSLSTLLLAAVCGAGGWFAGEAAHDGMRPAARPRHQPADARFATAAPEPRVPADSPAGKWMVRAKAAAPDEVAALLEEIPGLFPQQESAKRDAALKWLLGLWITRDVDGAHDYVAGKSRDAKMHGYFGMMLGMVAPEKVEAILQKSPLRMTHPFTAATLRSLAETDPLTFLKLKPSEFGANRHFARALRTLAARDPAAAAAALVEKSGGHPQAARHEALTGIVNAWTARDPAAVHNWLNGLQDADLRHRAQHARLSALARTDLATAQRELAKMDAGTWLPEQDDGRVAIVAALARVNLPEAVREMERLSASVKAPEPSAAESSDPFAGEGESPPDMWRAAAEAVAPGLPRDPAQLLAALREIGKDCGMDANLRRSMQSSMAEIRMREWNAETALEALKLLLPAFSPPQDQLSESLRGRLTDILTQADPELSLHYYASLSEARRKTLSFEFIRGIIDAGDPALTLQMAPLVHPDGWHMNGANTLAGKLAETPDAAKEIIEGIEYAAAHSDFAAAWARRDPGAAAQWVASQPEDVDAARGLAESWAGFDDTAASAWVAQLPNGKLRDGAARGLVNAIAPMEPEAAWNWAAAISSPRLAAEAFRTVAGCWGNQAPPRFAIDLQDAMQSGGFSQEETSTVLESLKQPPPERHLNP